MCKSTNIGLKILHLMIVTDLAKQVRQKGNVMQACSVKKQKRVLREYF